MSLVWATRGRSWGFRFLLDGGYSDPLPIYDRAFAGTESELTVCRRVGTLVALRIPDPVGRRDKAGRLIPHDIVVQPPLADEVRTVEDGQRIVWPLLANTFDRVWDMPRPPESADILRAIGNDLGGLGTGADGRQTPLHDPEDEERSERGGEMSGLI